MRSPSSNAIKSIPQPENSKITEKLSRKLIPVRIAAGKQMQAQLQSDL